MTDANSTETAEPTPSDPPLKSGLRTSEAILTFVIAVLALLPSSGLFPVDSAAVKVAGLIVAGFAALGYQHQRTSLKRAHLERKQRNATVGQIGRS